MTYRVYSGPRGSEEVSVFDRGSMLFKEFATLDQALSWAQHINAAGRVALRVEGDDGTALTRSDIATTLHHRENDRESDQAGRKH